MYGSGGVEFIDNKGSLISQCQQIQYDNANKWKTNVREAEQPQHHMAIKSMNWIDYLF